MIIIRTLVLLGHVFILLMMYLLVFNRDRQLSCSFLDGIVDIPIGQPFFNVIIKIYLVGANSI